MLNLKTKPFADILADYPALKVNGDWLCLNIDPRTSWPVRPQTFSFEGQSLWVMPLTTDNYPGLAFDKPAEMNRDEGLALLHRALSVIAWMQDTGAVVLYMGGGNLPRMMGMRQTLGHAIRDDFDLCDLPAIAEDSSKLALALMREGRGLNHPAYSFLSFFRALEIAIPNDKARGDWVTANIDRIGGHSAQEALQNLRAAVQGDVGKHLRESGRHAIAHAQSDPIINPDDPRDAHRLQGELPIIEALAVLAIEDHLGIQTRHRMWQEHLYELRGWKAILPPQVIAESMNPEPADLELEVDLPMIDVRLRRSDPFPMLEKLVPAEIGFHNHRVVLGYRSADGLIELVFGLNFAEERLEFDHDNSLFVYDDGTAAAVRNGKERCRFLWDYFGNGEIQIRNSDTGALISRVDAYLPLNMFANLDGHNAELEAWDKMISEREQAEAEGG